VANHKSAKKRARQTIVRNTRNTIRRSSVKNAVKKLRLAITEGNKESAATLLVTAQKALAKLAKHGVIKRNSAARRTSRLASQVNRI